MAQSATRTIDSYSAETAQDELQDTNSEELIERYKINGCTPINAAELSEPKTNGNKGQIQPGQVLNPTGRPKGTRNALSEAFIKDVHKQWLEHGPEALDSMLRDTPTKFCQLVAQIIPKDFQVSVSDTRLSISEYSFEELADMLRIAEDKQ